MLLSFYILMIDKIEKKICFVSLCSYSLLNEENIEDVGGAEIQQVKLSKELMKRGYFISFIIYGKDHICRTLPNGIKILQTYERNNVKKYSIIKKALVIYKKMKEANADIYYNHGGSPGITTLFCLLNSKNIITHLASDADVSGENIMKYNIFTYLLNKIGKWIDIKFSDKVVSQNSYQKLKLKGKYNVDSIIIKNSIDLSEHYDKKSIGEYLLWVGTIRAIKQPELFLKVAQFFPQNKFVMIGGAGESPEYYTQIKKNAEKIKNVEFKGFVPTQLINSYYQNAILLINTSKTEGFPNTFLEAWAHSIPVVSLNVDPDGIISQHNLGYHSTTFEQLLIDIKNLLTNIESITVMGKNGRKYVEENHDIEKIMDQYEILIKSLVNN